MDIIMISVEEKYCDFCEHIDFNKEKNYNECIDCGRKFIDTEDVLENENSVRIELEEEINFNRLNNL